METRRIKGNEINGYVVQEYIKKDDVWMDLHGRVETYDAAVELFKSIKSTQSERP